MGKFMKKFWRDEEGIGTLEIILIIAVVVIIAVAFRKWIVSWVQHFISKSNTKLNSTDVDSIDIKSTTP